MTKYIRNNYLKLTFVLVCMLIIVMGLSCLLLFTDESFSMNIIRYSFKNIIRLDGMDVHPPLYYIVLKIFISVTTFWTKSLFVKIVFARILSLITSVITFLFLMKIKDKFSFKKTLNLSTSFLIFVLLTGLPFKFVPLYNIVQIRMYSLAAMFVAIQIYSMLMFNERNERKYFILFTLSSILSAYTHYISGFISGLFVLSFIVFFPPKRFKYFISGIIMIISYIPWIPTAFHQFSQISGKHWWMTTDFFIKNVILILFIILLFMYPFINYLNRYEISDNIRRFIKAMIFVMALLIIVVVLTSIIGSPMFQAKYMYPVLLIYCFLGVNILIDDASNKRFYVSIIILFIGIGSLILFKNQTLEYNVSSLKVVNNLHEDRRKQLNINLNGDLQSPELQTKLSYYKYNDVYVKNYSNYINSFKNSNIQYNRNNYFLNKYIYFTDRKGN